jgi:hypothetical protein
MPAAAVLACITTRSAAACLLQAWRVLLQPFHAGFRIDGHGGQRLFDFVGNRCRELAQRVETYRAQIG